MKSKIIIISLIFCFLSCSIKNEKTVGFLLPDLKYEFYKKNESFFIMRAKELGFEVASFDAGGNEEVQYQQAMELIENGAKVIVICSVNANLAAAIVREAHKKNIKVIAYDRLIQNSDLDYYVTHNSVQAGELMAQYAISAKPKGNYMLLYGDRSDQNTLFVREGMLNVLQPLINSGNVKIVNKTFIEGWKDDEAFFEVNRFLHLSKDSLDVIISSSDDISRGVVNLYKKIGRPGKVIITGQNADIEALKNIVKGEQSMTVYKPIKDIAYMTADLVNELLNSTEPSNLNSKTNNGKIDVPTILIPVQTINKDNIQEILINGGYCTKEEIYGN